jgi:hypothetical protein
LAIKRKGVMEINIPAGDHKIVVEFKETPMRLLADIISLISLFVWLFKVKNLMIRKYWEWYWL